MEASNPECPRKARVEDAEIRTVEATIQTFARFVQAGWIELSEHNFHEFIAMAKHVRRITGTAPNHGGLFWALIRDRQFDYISQKDEDEAEECLKEFLCGTPGWRGGCEPIEFIVERILSCSTQAYPGQQKYLPDGS